MKTPAMTCVITLPDGKLCEVGITVIGEPRFPTPQEPDQRREPMISEWSAILKKLLTMDFRLVS